MQTLNTIRSGRIVELGRSLVWVAGGALASAAWTLADEALVIPNHSFERPVTSFVTLELDSWERFPKPAAYVEEGGFLWSQLTGTFANAAPGSSDHLTNLQGNQSMWVFAVPDNGVWNRVLSSDGVSEARVVAGDSYRLTVDLLGTGGAMKPGVPITLSVQALGSGVERIPVASFTVTNSVDLFPVRTRMRTFEFVSDPVPAGHPAVGQGLAVEVRSTVSPADEGGYWNVDALQLVRLSPATLELTILGMGDVVRLGWGSRAGWRYRLHRSATLGVGEPMGAEISGTGETMVMEVPVEPEGGIFFRLHGMPPQ